MHMADALISPVVGGAMWGASASAIAYCCAEVRREADDRKVPLMGVLGAFVFAAQMINFTIPATGSSGHLGGGLLLAILLGPHAAFLTIASVLVVQALFFADGGLLALGCNIFNLGFFPAFIAYPLLYRKIADNRPGRTGITAGAIIAGVAGLQLGAFCVVLETVASGISALPLVPFAILMQPIHLVIGIVEGVVTAAVVSFVYRARPEMMSVAKGEPLLGATPLRKVTWAFLCLALLLGGLVSGFASKNPDGLEWSVRTLTGREKLEATGIEVHGLLASMQEKLAFLPDYGFSKSGKEFTATNAVDVPQVIGAKKEEKPGKGVAGVAGGLLSLAVAALIAFMLKLTSTPGNGEG